MNNPVADTQFHCNLDTEEELDTIFDQQEAKYLYQIAVAQQEKEEAEKREIEAKLREKETMLKLATKMKTYGEPLSEIIKETGLTKNEIEKL